MFYSMLSILHHGISGDEFYPVGRRLLFPGNLDCIRMSIEAAATNERTVADWNNLLRANREHFPVPDPKSHKQKKPLPDLLEYFLEEITMPWVDYCISNLTDLTVESAQNELVTKMIPTYCSEAADEENDENTANVQSTHQKVENVN